MPDEVESMFYRMQDRRRDVPWHGLGLPMDDYLTAAEAVAATPELASEVDTWPLYAVDPNDGKGFQVERQWATVRVFDRKPLGIVGDAYVPMQTPEMARFVDEVCGTQEAKFETGGTLRGGAVVWLLAKLDRDLIVAGDADEKLAGWVLIQNWHDGGGSLQVSRVRTRVVCMNTLNAANREQGSATFFIRHTEAMKHRVEAAQRALGIVAQQDDALLELANGLILEKFGKVEAEKLAADLWPIPGEASKITTRNRQQRREEFLAVWAQSEDLANIRNTRWGAYNAVAEYADHGLTVRSESRKHLEARMQAIVTDGGTAAKLKGRALALLTK